MLMTGKRIEITQLPGRDHPDKIFLTPLQSNLIGILAPAKRMGLSLSDNSSGVRKSVRLKFTRWESRSC
jgi:hypothetical protein